MVYCGAMSTKFKSASPGRIQNLIFWIIALMGRTPFISRKLIVGIEILKYQVWVNEVFPQSKFHFRREGIWRKMVNSCQEDSIQIIELGVAWGYATNWFLEEGFPANQEKVIKKTQTVKMDSFDLFTGLPNQWRNHREGFFSNDGIPPMINDSRVTFHVGYVEENILNIDLTLLKEIKKIILFDLDLYQPSLFCYNYVKSTLNVGDILYFDEAFDEAEFTILKQEVNDDFVLKSLGHSGLAIAVQIEGVRNKS